MDDCKKTARQFFVPSLFALTQVISTILIGYGCRLNLYDEIFSGIFLLVLSFSALPFIVRNSLPSSNEAFRKTGPPAKNGPEKNNISFFPRGKFRSCCFLLLGSAILIYFTASGIRSALTSCSKTSPTRGIVERVDSHRYNKEIILKSIPACGAAAVSRRCAVFFPSGTDIREGDEIVLFPQPKEITRDQVKNSAFHRNKIRSGIRAIAYAGENDFGLIKRAGITPRDVIRKSIEKTADGVFSSRTSALVKALYFGESTYVDKQTISSFKRAGVLHILAASGFNVGIVAAVPFFLLSPLRISKKLILLIGVGLSVFYLYITGMPVSLIRATIMFSVFALQKFFDLDSNIFNALFISAIIILLIYPHELYNLGFQLTYGATLGIIVLFRAYKSSIPRLPSFIRNSLALTLSAQALVFPIILINLHEVNLAGIVSNLILIPGTSAVFLLSMAACSLAPFAGYAARILGSLTDVLSAGNLYAVEFLAESGGHFYFIGPVWLMLIPYILYLLPTVPARGRWRSVLPLSILSSFFISWIILSGLNARGFTAAVLSSPESRVIACRQGAETIVYGRLGSREDTERLLNFLNITGTQRLALCIPAPDYPALSNYAIIVKRSIVSRCIIGSGFRFSAAMTGMCSLLDADHIALELRDLPEIEKEDLQNPISFMNRAEKAFTSAGPGGKSIERFRFNFLNRLPGFYRTADAQGRPAIMRVE